MQRGAEVSGPEEVIRVQTFSFTNTFGWFLCHVTDLAIALSHLFTGRSCWFAVCSALWVIIDYNQSL